MRCPAQHVQPGVPQHRGAVYLLLGLTGRGGACREGEEGGAEPGRAPPAPPHWGASPANARVKQHRVNGIKWVPLPLLSPLSTFSKKDNKKERKKQGEHPQVAGGGPCSPPWGQRGGGTCRPPSRPLMLLVKYLFKKEALLRVQDLSTRGAGRAGRPAGLVAPEAREALEKLRDWVFSSYLKYAGIWWSLGFGCRTPGCSPPPPQLQ